VFPLEIDIDNPRYLALLNKLLVITDKASEKQAKGGWTAKLSKMTTSVKAGWVFLQLFTMRSKPNEAPANVRLAPGY
jgi:magnesium-protoporphyrin IX monomethyl ester (oxidative) cyclase